MSEAGMPALVEAMSRVAKQGGIVHVSEMTGAASAIACARLMNEIGRQIMIIVPTQRDAEKLAGYLAFFAPGKKICVLPDEERTLFSYDARSRENSNLKLECMSVALSGEEAFFVCPVMAAACGMESEKTFQSDFIDIKNGSTVDYEKIKDKLAEFGYEREDLTEVRGQFSVRGGIIDVFPPDFEYPCRIDLFDDEVDGLKLFDPVTQRSVRPVESIHIIPATVQTAESAENASFFWDYMNAEKFIFADDWTKLCEQRKLADLDWTEGAGQQEKEVKSEYFAGMDKIVSAMEKYGGCISTEFWSKPEWAENIVEKLAVIVHEERHHAGRLNNYAEELRELYSEKYKIVVACSGEERIKNLKEFAFRAEINIPPENLTYVDGQLPHGLRLPQTHEVFISDHDIFRARRKKRRDNKKKEPVDMSMFADIRKGDYVVHENHGIGRFEGIKPLVIDGSRKDYIKIKYAEGDLLYVPVEQMDIVQKYIGSGGTAPRLNKLSGGEWKKTKARAKAAIEHMAQELVDTAAERMIEPGHSFEPDTAWQHQFEDMFPYAETDDQLRCTEEIKQDMQLPWPMERLLCGDVGFGKTEVAARAIFKCIMEGKQAALLVPTTILAAQHYKTFVERFSSFPCTIGMLSRFRTETQIKETLRQVADGRIDILIGTHRMLSNDVKFKDLGLLVIDEEQRFGVQHKEALKKIKHGVDVLMLSATPIPRTLHMTLSGIKSMSTLNEPIEDRHPVQTYVLEQDDDLIREILVRELGRKGQAFVVFNRVKGINTIADGIRNLVPDARVAVAHGRMSETKLEDVMQAFMNHEYDILVSTTIIESGIDIPDANTLIVLDADRFGLAQLYQLRGRVGRSDRKAYAYLMYKKDKNLTEAAEKRLKAIREFTEFGSGFKVAMKDLEIRGAGNLLGTEQSGHMMLIGYELYCKLIDQAVRRLRGEKISDEEREALIDLKVNAFISSDYISDEKTKLDMYRKIAAVRTKSEASDMIDELADRFGDVPEETLSLIKVALIKAACCKVGIIRVSLDKKALVFEFDSESNKLDFEVVNRISNRTNKSVLISYAKTPHVSVKVEDRSKILDEAYDFLTIFKLDGEEKQE